MKRIWLWVTVTMGVILFSATPWTSSPYAHAPTATVNNNVSPQGGVPDPPIL